MCRAWPVAVLLLLVVPGVAGAGDGCSFERTGTTWTLVSDCTTDTSIVLPDNVTLDGAQYTIMATDPSDGSFRGGIIVARGASAAGTNTVIRAMKLADGWQTSHDRLRAS